MNKGLLALSMVCVPVLHATEARIIQYKVTVYRDAEHFDEASWDQMTRDAHRVVARAKNEVRADACQVLSDAIQNITEADGIHGEIMVSISDGSCSTKCSDDCVCTKRYNGLCPCSNDEAGCNSCDADIAIRKESSTQACEAGCADDGVCTKKATD